MSLGPMCGSNNRLSPTQRLSPPAAAVLPGVVVICKSYSYATLTIVENAIYVGKTLRKCIWGEIQVAAASTLIQAKKTTADTAVGRGGGDWDLRGARPVIPKIL